MKNLIGSEKVRLSQQGVEYLNNPNCSSIVRAVLNSIDTFSAEILDLSESIVRVKLSEFGLPEEFLENNDFAVHRDHLSFL